MITRAVSVSSFQGTKMTKAELARTSHKVTSVLGQGIKDCADDDENGTEVDDLLATESSTAPIGDKAHDESREKDTRRNEAEEQAAWGVEVPTRQRQTSLRLRVRLTCAILESPAILPADSGHLVVS